MAAAAYWQRALTLDGAVAAAAVGGVVFARGGLPAAGALLAFFLSSTALSRVGEQRKQRLPLAQAKGARRDAWQVLANGGVASLCALANQRAGFVGALAAAAADTWATELGLLARARPRLITTLQPVSAGTSGAITAQGLIASLGGALLIGLAWAALGGSGSRSVALRRLWSVALAGMFASLADSLLGATAQALYHCARCDAFIEEQVHRACGGSADLVCGYEWITNDTVNALATVVGAAIAALLRTPNAAGHVRGGG